MRQIILLAGLFLTLSVVGQNKLTPKQIERMNYKEVLGNFEYPNNLQKPDKYAMYPDGLEGINKFVSKHLKYPQKAVENKIQGTVVLQFIVESDGTIQTFKIIQSVDPEIDAEALRVMKKLETWVPGYANGIPVSVLYQYPINFKF